MPTSRLSAAAPLHLDYWTKNASASDSILWNIPEQKSGTLQLLGGNSQNFATIIRTAEFCQALPLQEVRLLLPEPLRHKIPPLPGIDFAPATDSGSFAQSATLDNAIANADFTLCLGDFSKNSATAIALASALQATAFGPASPAAPRNSAPGAAPSPTPILLTRDSVDLLTAEMPQLITNQRLFLLASLAQLQKVFRALYYPKMLLLSMPLVPVVETLHKFTLSYPATIITFHQGQIIVAQNGQVASVPLENTRYTPLTLWSGPLACQLAALNLWNPTQPLAASVTALTYGPRHPSPSF